MKPNIFMSYSRREVGFVDDLTQRLEKEGYHVWLDYRSLAPGTPWAEQIDRGVDESQVILLVVSKASIASQYVEMEWRRVLTEKNKRIILLIFEAVDLPPELEQFEWVDFRGNYDAGIKELCGQVDAPVVEEYPAPETGFKIPSIVWRAFGLSLITAVFSLKAWWSLFVPYFLLTLPYRILKRDFSITQVQAALWLLPVVLFLTVMNDDISNWESWLAILFFFLSLVIAPTLVFVLRSKGIQRWGKPEACLTKFNNQYRADELRPQPVSFFIDHAPQDRRVADELTHLFQKHNHPQAANIRTAEVVFVLLSKFKQDTDADPESQTVLPVLIQACTPAAKLSKVQWIDFRGGMRNLEAMAKLLHEPTRLLAALGVRPAGNQLILPPIIRSMYYFLILLGMFILGSLILFGSRNRQGFFSGVALTFTTITLPLVSGLIFLLIRALTQRSGKLASFLVFSLALLGIGLLIILHFFGQFFSEANAKYDLSVAFPGVAYFVGMPVMAIFLLYRFRDVRRWFPAKAPKRTKEEKDKVGV